MQPQAPKQILKIRVGAGADSPSAGFYSKCVRRWVPVNQISPRLLKNSSLVMPEFSWDDGATIIKYAGVIDIDAKLDPEDRKRVVAQVADLAPGDPITDSAVLDAFRSAEVIANFVSEKTGPAAQPPCVFFTGSKGARILLPPASPALFARVLDSQSYGPNFMQAVVRPVFLDHADTLDPCVFDPAKGVKPDVHPHPNTGAWPAVRPVKSDAEDADLSKSICDFWTGLAAYVESVAPDDLPFVEGPPRTSRKRAASGPTPPSVRSVLADIAHPSKKRKGADASTFHELHPWGAHYFRPADGDLRRAVISAHSARKPMVINEIVPPCTRFFIDVDNLDPMPHAPVICRIVKLLWDSASPVTVLRAQGEKKSFHLVWYKLYVAKEAALATRNLLVREISAEIPDVDWDTHIDAAVYSTSLRILGSDKEIKRPDGSYAMAGRPFAHHADIAPDGTISHTKRPFAPVLNATLLSVPGACPADPPPDVQTEIVQTSHTIASGTSVLTSHDVTLAKYVCENFLPARGPYTEAHPVGATSIVCISTNNRECPIANKEHKSAKTYVLVNVQTGKVHVKCFKCSNRSKRLL